MPKYNPNAIWTSKKEDEEKKRQNSLTGPAKKVEPKSEVKPISGGSTAKPIVMEEKTMTGTPATTPFFKKTPVEDFDHDTHPKSRAFLWSAIVFVLLLVGGGLYIYLMRPAAALNVTMGFSTQPAQVLVGDPFDLHVALTNSSGGMLNNATLSVLLPDNISFVGQSAGQRVMQETIGNIGPGSINGEDFNLIVTGDPNSVADVTAKLTYGNDANGQSQFETDGDARFAVGGSAISLNLTTPTAIFSGQNFATTVNYVNNTSNAFNDVELALQYPPVFTFVNSSMPADSVAQDSWDLGTIPAGGTGSFTVTGNIVGPNNALYQLMGTLTGQVQGDTYPLSSQSASLAIGASPLSLSITLNNDPNYIAAPNDALNYTLNYTNTSNITFQNVVVKAVLTGTMFDLSTLNSNGSFNSLTNTVTWSPANTPAFLNLAAGQSGSVQLQLKTKAAYPVGAKDLTLQVMGQISSPTVPPGTSASSTVSAATAQNDVGGNITIAAKGLWRDAASGLLNTGPYPPKVNQQTEYTIHWDIANYVTDADNVTVSAYLQSGTTCTGQIKSNLPTAPTCDAASGLVTWMIPSVPAGTGIVSMSVPAEAIIQVENTPAVNQVGQDVTLLGPTTLSATDAFTSSTLQATASAVTTALPDDTTISSPDRRVTQ